MVKQLTNCSPSYQQVQWLSQYQVRWKLGSLSKNYQNLLYKNTARIPCLCCVFFQPNTLSNHQFVAVAFAVASVDLFITRISAETLMNSDYLSLIRLSEFSV